MLLMIILAIIYFVITIWVIKVSADLVLGKDNWDTGLALLSAALITLGATLSGAVGGRSVVNVIVPQNK